jgi:hypothetical protein
VSSINILEDYVGIGQFADAVGKHPRTILRWTSVSEGLPFVKLGKTRLIHMPSARQWLVERIQRPNPSRRRRFVPFDQPKKKRIRTTRA